MRMDVRQHRAGDVVDWSRLPVSGIRVALLAGDSLLRPGPSECLLVIVVRGRAAVSGRDGRMRVAPRQWLLLGRDGADCVQTHGPALVVVARADAPAAAGLEQVRHAVLPLRARLDRGGLRRLRGLVRLYGSAEGGNGDASLCDSLLVELHRGDAETQRLLTRVPGRSLARKRQVLCRLLRARLYIEGHPERIVRITELARLSSFSPWHFTKTFHQLFGQSPQAFGTSVRLARARELVCDTRMAIGEVAAAVGFENACSFARAFHERYGETATQMRARLLQPETPRRRRLAN